MPDEGTAARGDAGGSRSVADSRTGRTPGTNVVTLNLAAADDVSGVQDMRLSTDPSFAGASFQPFASSATLDVGGNTVVHVQYRDRALNAGFDRLARG